MKPPRLTAPSHRANDTVTVLAAAGLRPILDVELDRVLADCPCCDAGAGDPLGMYRPLIVGCFGTGPVRLFCNANGCSPAAVRLALAEPPIPWQAVAHEYRDLALEAVAQLQRVLAPAPRLEVAA